MHAIRVGRTSGCRRSVTSVLVAVAVVAPALVAGSAAAGTNPGPITFPTRSPASNARVASTQPTLLATTSPAPSAFTNARYTYSVYQGSVVVATSGPLTDPAPGYTVPAGVLASSTQYSWEIVGTASGSGYSTTTASGKRSFFTPLPPPPAPASVSAAAAGDGAVAVSWTPSAASGSTAPVDGYGVRTYLSDGTYLGEQQTASTSTTLTVTGLTPGKSYYFTVAAHSSVGFSAYTSSNTVQVTGYTGAPGSPVGSPVSELAPQPLPAPGTGTLGTVVDGARAAVDGAAPPVLGYEDWQSYVGVNAGGRTRASVNVANGNLVVQTTDSTPVQAHGRLAYVLRRTYNSQTPAPVVTPAGSVGARWSLNLGEEAGDFTSVGLTGDGLEIPDPASLAPGAVTLVDRDGTRHTFTPKTLPGGLALSSPLMAAGQSPGSVAAVARRALTGQPGLLVCVTQTYTAPAGVHLGLYRFVQLGAGVSACPADPTTAPGAAVLGYAAVRPDRVRTEYAATGELLSMTDATGVELRYVYANDPAPGTPVGALRYVYEPRSCSYRRVSATDPGTMPAQCRSFTLSSGPDGLNSVVDPAGRSTTYSRSAGQLQSVGNPDATALDYEYQGVANPRHTDGGSDCGGTAAQLCTVWDGRGGRTRFTYEAAPSGPPRVKTVTDRRGLVSTFDYGQSTTTVTAGQHRQVFTGIDAAGRVARLAATDTAGTLYRDTRITWDTLAAPCDQPDPRLDNNQCRVQAVQTSSQPGAAPGQDTQTTFSEQGLPLAVRRADGTGGYDTTTAGFRTQHVGPTGTTVYTDSISGSGQVTSSTAQPGPRSGGGGTLYVVTDRVATLTARGNAAPAQGAGTPANPDWTGYQTRFTVDATETVTPGTADPTGVCSGAQTNTGLVCAVDAPAYDSTGRPATTRFTYDPFGQRTTMTTPKAVAETPAGQTPPSYRYDYYPDASTDLSGLGNAGGWLRGVTDPAGAFVAYGYDRAGNVVRTWDRNATAGRALTEFPGTLASPTTARYTETLYGDVGSSRDPGSAAVASAVGAPWRYVRSTRDALGNRTSSAVDANGNPTRITPPRGTQAAPAGGTAPPTYDVTAGYDPGDLQVRSLTPGEAQANGSPTDKPTTTRYDSYGVVTLFRTGLRELLLC